MGWNKCLGCGQWGHTDKGPKIWTKFCRRWTLKFLSPFPKSESLRELRAVEEAELRPEKWGILGSHILVCFSDPMSRARNVIVATGLVAFAAAGLAFPFYMASSKRPVIDPSKPLPPQATFRGPYINTGSRDVGPDNRTYPKK